MKAIKATYLSPTNTKPARLKAQTYGHKPMIKAFDHYYLDGGTEVLAEEYARSLGWNLEEIAQAENNTKIFVFTE